MSSNPQRVLLDSNVWRYVLDRGLEDELARLAATRAARIQVAPITVYEALGASDQALRKRLCRVMARGCWDRLMPEVYYECLEVRRAIEKHQPTWLSPWCLPNTPSGPLSGPHGRFNARTRMWAG